MAGALGGDRGQRMAGMRGDVGRGLAVGIEHVMVEDPLPGAALRRRQVAQRQQRQHQREDRRIHVGRRLPPPVVDQHVERVQRLHLVPPHAGDVERVARLELGDQRVLERRREAREALEVGLLQVDQADRLAGRREVDRTDIQVGQLLRREQREAAMAGRHAGDVVGQVVVRRDAAAIAQPDAGQRLRRRRAAGRQRGQVQVVVRAKAGQAVVDRRRADVVAGRTLDLGELEQLLHQRRQRRVGPAEVHAGEVVVVEDAAVDLRRAGHDGHRRAAPAAVQVVDRGAVGAPRLPHHRPMRHEAAQHHRLRGLDQVGRKPTRHQVVEFSDRLHAGIAPGGVRTCSGGPAYSGVPSA